MAQVDKIIFLKLKKKGLVEFPALYSVIVKWAKLNKYEIAEREYSDTFEKTTKSSKIEWDFTKKVDDYNKFLIKVKLNLRNYDIRKNAQKNLMNGELTIEFEGRIITDYEDKWTKGPFYIFIRGIIDKFITQPQREKLEAELESDIKQTYNHIKDFLGSLKEKD